MKGVPIDEALCAYLKKYHKGQENAASSKELEATVHVGGAELRRAVISKIAVAAKGLLQSYEETEG